MPTIDEMDEFFDFEAARQHPLSDAELNFNCPPSGPYDIDLAFAELENDEDAFTSLQHFGDTTPEEMLSFQLHDTAMINDTAMMAPEDFTDFPRWIDGMDVPSRPCGYCQDMKIHCKVIKEGVLPIRGSCTSCVALSRPCSLITQERSPAMRIPSSEPMSDAPENDEFRGMFPSKTSGQHKASMEELVEYSLALSASDLQVVNSSTEILTDEANPKVGARFSRESVRILRGWLSTHHRHPYPSDQEKESLRRQTGLNKTQITNWLANARRRGKVRAPRSTSPSPHQYSNGMDIPRRSGTPALREMDPLERWKNSPPENEPASVTAIAKAVSSSTFSSGHESPHTANSYGHTDDGSARSLFNASSASSLGTSHGTSHSSGGSFASAFSHKSRGSFRSYESLGGNRGRRRRRRQTPKPVKSNILQDPPRTFQCTFCTETFKTKHDWQRHEKSLHLSLERWICSPNGHTQFNTETNSPCCVYCGISNPPVGHSEQHNHSSCVERNLEERTFYRKDHLRQHLNLVHEAKFQAWSMDVWKVATPEIRSRCGFCGIVMDSWTIRVDHLAEHFKGGKSMADWKGDWGFDSQVQGLVENGMPPYLIHDERNTMNPFAASLRDPTEKLGTLEDKVKLALVEYINEQVAAGSIPTDDDLLDKARKVIKKDVALSESPQEITWFRDLITFSGCAKIQGILCDKDQNNGVIDRDEIMNMTLAEKLDRINALNPTEMNNLDLITCSKERALKQYVKDRQVLGLVPLDSELQVQACKILDDIEATTNFKCKGAVQWFKYLITASPHWLADFRRRAILPRSSEMANELERPQDDKTIDYSIHNYHRLERELVDFVNKERKSGRAPTDADLQRTARMIIFESDDPWNQTAADDPAYLEVFKRQNGLAPIDENSVLELPEPSVVGALGLSLLSSLGSSPNQSLRTLHWDLENTGIGLPSPVSASDNIWTPEKRTPILSQPIHTSSVNQPSTNTNPTQPLRYFLNDANCYGRLVRELSRFVTTSMSPNNPTCHVPTDEEIQNQARWVIYDDDDPWNQTAADNAEWLIRFKRDVGILTPSSGPGLPQHESSWMVAGGGSGFSPPYLHPKPDAKLPDFKEDVDVKVDQNLYKINPDTAQHYVKSLHGQRYQKPATVFCSRDLENGLTILVQDARKRGITPSDGQLRLRAREILGVEKTAADERDLLEKFKALHGLPPSPSYSPASLTGGPMPDYTLPNFTDDISMLSQFDMELGAMDFSTEFSTGTFSNIPAVAGSGSGHVSPSLSFGMDDFNMGEMEETIGIEGLGTRTKMGHISPLVELAYADVQRVHAATASPLRRNVSERLAKGSGLPLSEAPGSRLSMGSTFGARRRM